MACGSCGQRREERARVQNTVGSQSKPSYTVTAPDGTEETFTTYAEAVAHKHKVNGALSTAS